MEEKTRFYVKDNNLLQLGLFYFGKRRPVPKETITQWSDDNGSYELFCNCSLGVPGSMEQDTYTACMRLWFKQGLSSRSILITYSDIAKELGLNPKSWCSKIKKSLEKLGQARYRFNQCFVKADRDGNTRVDALFSLFDTALLFSRNKKWNDKSQIFFPDIIAHNLEAEYYQLLDINQYKALPSGLPRRLYEYLAKRQYHCNDDVFTVSEVLICRWLPITDQNKTKRKQYLKKIADQLIDKGLLDKYEFDKAKNHCHFTYSKHSMQIRKTTKDIEKNHSQKKLTPIQKSFFDDTTEERSNASTSNLESLIALVKTKNVSNKLQNILAQYLQSNGYRYVKDNILYSNKNAKTQYSTYLQKSLAENWAEEWVEENARAIKAQDERQKQQKVEQLHKVTKVKKAEKNAEIIAEQRKEFRKKIMDTPKALKDKLMKQADIITDKNLVSRGMDINITYSELLFDYFNKKGANFSKEIFGKDLSFIREICTLSAGEFHV